MIAIGQVPGIDQARADLVGLQSGGGGHLLCDTAVCAALPHNSLAVGVGVAVIPDLPALNQLLGHRQPSFLLRRGRITISSPRASRILSIVSKLASRSRLTTREIVAAVKPVARA